jgi:hypothetical protein
MASYQAVPIYQSVIVLRQHKHTFLMWIIDASVLGFEISCNTGVVEGMSKKMIFGGKIFTVHLLSFTIKLK